MIIMGFGHRTIAVVKIYKKIMKIQFLFNIAILCPGKLWISTVIYYPIKLSIILHIVLNVKIYYWTILFLTKYVCHHDRPLCQQCNIFIPLLMSYPGQLQCSIKALFALCKKYTWFWPLSMLFYGTNTINSIMLDNCHIFCCVINREHTVQSNAHWSNTSRNYTGK